jgi:hypothetical protein
LQQVHILLLLRDSIYQINTGLPVIKIFFDVSKYDQMENVRLIRDSQSKIQSSRHVQEKSVTAVTLSRNSIAKV